jgi:hypothetical protein
MLTASEIRELREKYVASLDQENAPAIATFCQDNGYTDDADIKKVLRLAKKENWEAHRVKRRAKLALALEKREDKLIAKLADDMMQVREGFIKDQINEVNDLLPKMIEELRARMETGFFDDKALIQGIKLMMESRSSLMALIDKQYGSDANANVAQQGNLFDFLNRLAFLSRLVEVNDGKISSVTLDPSNYKHLSEQDDKERTALTELDSEVLNEK